VLLVLVLLLLVLLLLEGAQVATSAATGFVGRSLRCYIFANQQSKFQTSSPPLFLFLDFFIFLSLSRAKMRPPMVEGLEAVK